MRKIVRKVPGGKLLKIELNLEKNTISEIRLYGDFFIHPEESITDIEKSLINVKLTKQHIIDSIRTTITKNNIQMIGITGEAIADAILSARPWRLIIDGAQDAAINMAIDEAILSSFEKNNIPTLRFYQWEPKAVSIGYFQNLLDEVDEEKARKKGVDIVRRITGGGAVFHDNELTYSIVLPDSPGIISSDIQESYKKICSALIRGLGELGIIATFSPINDILAKEKKLSGNAQTRRYSAVLQHGTILLDVDVEQMFTLLKVPTEKLKDKMIKKVKQRVTSLKEVSEKPIDIPDLILALRKGFEQEFKTSFEKGELTEDEKALAVKLSKSKFSNKEWNYNRKNLNKNIE